MVGVRDVSSEKTLANSSGVAGHLSPVWSMQTKDGGKNTGVLLISGVPLRVYMLGWETRMNFSFHGFQHRADISTTYHIY